MQQHYKKETLMRHITKEQIKDIAEITFTSLFEDSPYEDMFSDDRDIQWVHDQLNMGNDAAWFVAKVTATIGRFEGVDTLGGCSYLSFTDFEQGVYYTDMVQTALDCLVDDINSTIDALKELV